MEEKDRNVTELNVLAEKEHGYHLLKVLVLLIHFEEPKVRAETLVSLIDQPVFHWPIQHEKFNHKAAATL